MHLSSVSLAVVCLFSIPRIVRGSKAPIGLYQILSAGDGSTDKPIINASLVSNSFTLNVFFEFSNSSEVLPISMELFSGLGGSAVCTDGSPLNTSLYTTKQMPGPNYSTITTDGIIGTAEYTISDLNAIPSSAYTVYPNASKVVNLCARTSIKKDYGNGLDYVSYLDSLVQYNAIFDTLSGFSTTTNVSYTAAGRLDENVTRKIEMEAFLCANNGAPATAYKMGTDFTVCVRPLIKFVSEGYSMHEFVNVTCQNSVYSHELFASSVAGLLTTQIDNTSSYLSASGEAVGAAAKAFKSVVVAGYFVVNEPSFTCSGDVKVAFNNTLRRLTSSFSRTPLRHNNVEDFHPRHHVPLSTLPRELQEAETTEDSELSPFETSIGLVYDASTNANLSSATTFSMFWSRNRLVIGFAIATMMLLL